MEEEEEMEREGDGGQAQVRRPTWVIPYEGKFEPQEFPGGPSDKTVLYNYGAPHIARCVYDDFDREYINVVSNTGKLYDCVADVYGLKWWEEAMKATGLYGLARTGYSFLDPGLLATFVER
ncbi:serine/threonine-protein phosphatase 7 long form-like protein, partial [Trifolium medium]|nr:serine/threonine-protein phosphatase 7 long form-like protein [Trifolium medium]